MTKTLKITVCETVIETFDCEITVEIPDGADVNEELELIRAAVEERRLNGDDERVFQEIGDIDWWER